MGEIILSQSGSPKMTQTQSKSLILPAVEAFTLNLKHLIAKFHIEEDDKEK